VFKIARWKGATALAATAVSALVLSPAIGATLAKKRPPAISLSADSIGSFTPANADPKLAAAMAGRGLSLNDLSFTPAPAKGRPSQLRIAIRARTTTPAPQAVAAASTGATALAPSSYNLGVAVGWRRFAVAGDLAQVKSEDSAQGGRESALVGVSYSLNRFTGKLAVGADRPTDKPLPAFQRGNNYSLDVGGTYSLSKRIALTGGVRYQVERDRLSALKDDRRDSQAVYVGTAVKF
jgi:hypothetical protein